ncbi:MAG TPA: metalloregulator ArsR/SmtB family transcription factor [Chryseolinea sp.]|nr:metalloregulator ArsR/SmtB family transcription factor [Chryseolinea sp.]
MRRDAFQAIADPTRRDIISLVARNSMTQNDVVASFDVSRQAISKHLKILMECGILIIDQQGRERYYSLQPKKLAQVADWIEPFRSMWEDKFNRLDDILKKFKSNKHGK